MQFKLNRCENSKLLANDIRCPETKQIVLNLIGNKLLYFIVQRVSLQLIMINKYVYLQYDKLACYQFYFFPHSQYTLNVSLSLSLFTFKTQFSFTPEFSTQF